MKPKISQVIEKVKILVNLKLLKFTRRLTKPFPTHKKYHRILLRNTSKISDREEHLATL